MMTTDTGDRIIPARNAPVLFEEETLSTNTVLKERASALPHGTVLWCLRQSAGRGRSGRSFISPDGGLYYSMLLKFAEPDERLMAVTPLAAVAVVRAVRSVCGLKTEIKWPNDVLSDGKKICGILTESVVKPDMMQIIVGIGINVNTAAFPGLPEGVACSVFTETGRISNIAALAEQLTHELDRVFALLPRTDPADVEEYRKCCCTIGKKISPGGTAIRINDDFSLVTAFPDGTEKRIYFGEIFHE